MTLCITKGSWTDLSAITVWFKRIFMQDNQQSFSLQVRPGYRSNLFNRNGQKVGWLFLMQNFMVISEMQFLQKSDWQFFHKLTLK